MKKCPNCLSVFEDSTAIKCSNCGADLVEMQQEQPTYNNIPPQNNYTGYNGYNPQFKYCPNCGNQCDPKAIICVKCGRQFQDMYNQAPNADDKPSGILKVLCFFVPLLGLILYLVNNNDKPISAKAYGKMALIGFIVSIVAYAISIVLGVALAFILPTNPYVDMYDVYSDSDFIYSIINSIF